MSLAIIVHGGAGAWKLKEGKLDEAIAACEEAAAAGRKLLLEGGSSLDAVESAVCILEDCPVLDAGRGSYLNRRGEVEMDAIIMDGRTLSLGAVGAVQRVRHPISLARRVLRNRGIISSSPTAPRRLPTRSTPALRRERAAGGGGAERFLPCRRTRTTTWRRCSAARATWHRPPWPWMRRATWRRRPRPAARG